MNVLHIKGGVGVISTGLVMIPNDHNDHGNKPRWRALWVKVGLVEDDALIGQPDYCYIIIDSKITP